MFSFPSQSWTCIQPVSLPHSVLLYNQVGVSVLLPDTDRMELNKVLPEPRSVTFYHVTQLCALLCVIVITYKCTVLISKRRKMLSILQVFPGPPGHWLFGNVLQVKQNLCFIEHNILKIGILCLVSLYVIHTCLSQRHNKLMVLKYLLSLFQHASFFKLFSVSFFLFCWCAKLKDGSEFDIEMKWSQKYSNVLSIQLGPFDSYVSIHHPDYAKTLVSSSGKFRIYIMCE